jgi:hypothetical protein
MEFTPFYAAILILLIFINRPIAILFHELAHGITALILSREKVGIYVGSYGDRSECYHLKFGLLEIWLKKQFSLWNKGLCVPEGKNFSTNEQIFYIFMGPFMTLLIAFGIGVCVFLPNVSFPTWNAPKNSTRKNLMCTEASAFITSTGATT